MKAHTLILGLVATLLIAACAPLEVAAPPAEKLWTPKTFGYSQLVQGRQIYATSCVKCHGPARIDRRSDASWAQSIMPRMCRWSKLTPEQTSLVTAYVMAARQAMPKTKS